MSNIANTQILLDTNRKTIIKLTGEFDGTGQEVSNVKINGANLKFALGQNNNAYLSNNGIATNGLAPGQLRKTNYDYSISRINYIVSANSGYVKLSWDGTNAATIADLAQGQGDINYQQNMAVIQNNASTPNGNVSLTTFGFGANSSYTIIMELHKSANDYSFGQLQSPADFNYGTAGIKP